ncbi:MAG TPA: hypothetical protein VNF29_03745 [Candidatus Binataceae bacterium]|nr:hypothetical protein [Candidatus Binataceae bacterium]
MPRKSAVGITSALKQVQQQARDLLGDLHKQIRDQEAELTRLKDEASNLSRLIGPAPAVRAQTKAAAAPPIGRGRVNWRTILEELPKQFKAADVRGVRGLKAKRPSEIFAAITRWIDAGMARRKARGLYERI